MRDPRTNHFMLFGQTERVKYVAFASCSCVRVLNSPSLLVRVLNCAVLCRADHNPDFKNKITVRDYKDVDEDLRFALYDLDGDDRIAEEELVGEAVVKASLISSGAAVTLALTKGGKPVPDAFILLNQSEQVKRRLIAECEEKEKAAAAALLKAGLERNAQAAARIALAREQAAAQESYNRAAGVGAAAAFGV